MDNDKIKVEETSENSVEKVGSEEKLSIKKNKIIKYIVYGIILILALCGRNLPTVTEFDLGDFGSIVPMLLHSLSFMGFKWLPILSVIGIVLIFQRGIAQISFYATCFDKFFPRFMLVHFNHLMVSLSFDDQKSDSH